MMMDEPLIKDYELNHICLIRKMFAKLGIMPTYRGYHQCMYAILLCLENPNRLETVTKTLFPEVAKRYNVSPVSVERNIRTVVNIAWSYFPEVIGDLSGYNVINRPTVSQFISLLFLCVKNQDMQQNEKVLTYENPGEDGQRMILYP